MMKVLACSYRQSVQDAELLFSEGVQLFMEKMKYNYEAKFVRVGDVPATSVDYHPCSDASSTMNYSNLFLMN